MKTHVEFITFARNDKFQMGSAAALWRIVISFLSLFATHSITHFIALVHSHSPSRPLSLALKMRFSYLCMQNDLTTIRFSTISKNLIIYVAACFVFMAFYNSSWSCTLYRAYTRTCTHAHARTPIQTFQIRLCFPDCSVFNVFDVLSTAH